MEFISKYLESMSLEDKIKLTLFAFILSIFDYLEKVFSNFTKSLEKILELTESLLILIEEEGFENDKRLNDYLDDLKDVWEDVKRITEEYNLIYKEFKKGENAQISLMDLAQKSLRCLDSLMKFTTKLKFMFYEIGLYISFKFPSDADYNGWYSILIGDKIILKDRFNFGFSKDLKIGVN